MKRACIKVSNYLLHKLLHLPDAWTISHVRIDHETDILAVYVTGTGYETRDGEAIVTILPEIKTETQLFLHWEP